MTPQSKLFKLLAAPSPLPEVSATDINLSRYGERLLEQYIGAALSESLLPSSMLLAHYLHIPPPPNETPFEVPVIVKKDAAATVLGSFMEFRNPNRHRHLSLTEKVKRTNQDGTIIVMSSEPAGAKTNLCRHVHIQLKDLSDFSVPLVPESSLEDIGADDIGTGGAWSLYSHVGVDQIFNRSQRAEVDEPSRRVDYTGSDEDDEQFLRSLFDDGGVNYTNEYMFRVAPVVKRARVVFCVPKLYGQTDSSGKELSDEIGAGACVFYMDEDPDVETLENLYVISHKLCSVASNIYDIARIISEKKYRKDSIEILGSIYHSLSGTLTKGLSPNSTPDMVWRILNLERVTVSAAGALISVKGEKHPLVWANSGFNGESLGLTIGAALSTYSFTLVINDEAVRDHAVDPLLAVIIIELGRNLAGHAPREQSSAEIAIKRNGRNDRAVDVELFTTCSVLQARTLYANIQNSTDSLFQTPTKLRGTGLIVKLAHKLLDRPGGRVSWTFNYRDADIEEEINEHLLGTRYCHMIGPASIFKKGSARKNEELDMHFRAEGLISILD